MCLIGIVVKIGSRTKLY